MDDDRCAVEKYNDGDLVVTDAVRPVVEKLLAKARKAQDEYNHVRSDPAYSEIARSTYHAYAGGLWDSLSLVLEAFGTEGVSP